MGIFSKSGSRGHIDIDWNPLPLPKNTEDFRSRVTLESAMFEREPNRKYDYSSFLYLDNLPECKGITIEKLIACGPSTLYFTDKSQPATAFLTDKRLVHLGIHKGMYAAVGSFHANLLGVRQDKPYEVTANWKDSKCPVLGFGPRFSTDGVQNRFAREWWYSFAKIAEDKFI